MKLAFAPFIVFAIPLIICGILLVVVLPLLVQHIFKSKSSVDDTTVYPYLTSWEEAA